MSNSSGKLKFKYDKEKDILFGTMEDTGSCDKIEPQPGTIILFDSDSLEIVGVTIHDFKKKKEAGKLDSIPYFKTISIPAV